MQERSVGLMPLRAVLFTAGLISAVAFASCGDADSGPLTFDAPRRELGSADLRIEADGSGAPLRVVEDVVEGPDGGIHSLHARETFVRSWTADGRAVGTLGGGAEGTAGIPDPQALGVFDDTIWVVDGQSHRVHLFGPGGRTLGVLQPSVGPAGDPDAPWDLPPEPRWPLRERTFLGVSPAVSEAVARGDQQRTVHLRLGADGAIRDTVWIRAWRPEDVLALGRGGSAYGAQPFADSPLVEVAPGGDALVVLDRRVEEDRVPPAFHVTWIAMTGDTLARASVAYEPDPLGDARVGEAVSGLVERWRAFLEEGNDSIGAEELEEHIRAGLYVPPHLPPVSDLVVGTDGSAWLRRPGQGPRGTEWWVLGPDGGFRARVAAPPDLRVLWAGPDHVLGTVVDGSAGAPAIVRHPVGS